MGLPFKVAPFKSAVATLSGAALGMKMSGAAPTLMLLAAVKLGRTRSSSAANAGSNLYLDVRPCFADLDLPFRQPRPTL
jgi:hypothetical protein